MTNKFSRVLVLSLSCWLLLHCSNGSVDTRSRGQTSSSKAAISTNNSSVGKSPIKSFRLTHFFDSSGKQLTNLDGVGQKLEQFYGSSLPERVNVEFMKDGLSSFDPKTNTIFLNEDMYAKNGDAIVAHETAHLANAALSNGKSGENDFRFLDEGLANQVERLFNQNPEASSLYSQAAANIADDEIKNYGVGLGTMQNWDKYFGDGQNFAAYEAGSSFVDYLSKNGDSSKMLDLLKNIGETGNFEQSLQNVYGMTKEQAEVGWKESVANQAAQNPNGVQDYNQATGDQLSDAGSADSGTKYADQNAEQEGEYPAWQNAEWEGDEEGSEPEYALKQ